jgi:hypothetical protein
MAFVIIRLEVCSLLKINEHSEMKKRKRRMNTDEKSSLDGSQEGSSQ